MESQYSFILFPWYIVVMQVTREFILDVGSHIVE